MFSEEIKAELKNSSNENTTSSALPLPKRDSTSVSAEKYFLPFELACQSKASRIVVTALDCLQKLIAYGHLTGNVPDSTTQGKLLIDRIVETICVCFSGPQTDEGVQLQIIKALLTVVTSQNVEVHEGTVLLAVRTCYNIYLASKNLVNQTTARATLTQMLNVIFTRMENQAYEQMNKGGKSESGMKKMISQQNGSVQREDLPDTGSRGIDEKKNLNHSTVPEPIESEESKFNSANSVEENCYVNSFQSDIDYNDDEIVKEILYKIVDDVILKCTSADNSEQSVQGEKTEITRIPSQESVEVNSTENEQVAPPKFSHILQKDAFLVFRSLCKLSMKPLPDGVPDPK